MSRRAGSRPRPQDAAEITVRSVAVGDARVRVSTIGRQGERAFVLVPGIGVSSDYFEALAPHLNEFGPVHALDLPGFGGVPHLVGTPTITRYADLVGAVVDELGLTDPVLVGHSMGSQVVTDLAARRPALSTLVLIGPVVDASARRIPRQAWEFLRCARHEPGRVKLLALSSYLVCGWRWFARVLPQMMSYPIDEHLPRVRAATLIVRGELDHVSPRRWVDHLLAVTPRSRGWQIPEAAHSVMYAHAAEVARLCVGHVRQPPDEADGTGLRELDEDALPPLVPPVQPRRRLSGERLRRVVAGRLLEWRGLLSRDETLISRGKTERGRALVEDQGDTPD